MVCSPQETFGKVSAEALACGTPVIANDWTANPEVAGSECGIVIHDNNDAEILAAVKNIRKLGKEFYSEKCIKRAQNNFLSTTQIEMYLDVAKRLME